MSQAHEPLVVLTDREENVELINRTLRDAGQVVRCHWIDNVDRIGEALAEFSPSMLFLFCEGDLDMISRIAEIRTEFGSLAPIIAVADDVHESSITAAMQAGAQDLVSSGHAARLCAVAKREFRAQRLERALNETLDSASAYRKQLMSLKASSEDAIACAQEGVVVEANHAWALLFGRSDPSDLHGQPVMDLFELGSRATLKGGLIACEGGRWDKDSLRVTALTEDGTTPAIELWLEKTVYDDGPAIQLRVHDSKPQATEPRQLVEETVHRDPITGFYHRRHFLDMMKQRLETNHRGGVRVLAYLRPDRFGEIKDDIGPLASEDVLVQLAEVVRGLTQPNDLYGRFGGVVFAILLERGTIRDVEAWADNAITTISDHLFEIGEKTVSVTCTLGLSEVTRGADRIESIVIEAEQANNRGRQRGGNQVVLAEISDESTRIRRFDLEWVERIKAALLNGRFRLVHLPIVSLSGEEGARFDTVMRMLDEQGDEVPAGEFMPAAERHGLLKTLDRWVIGSSIAYAAEHSPDALFVKLSKDSVIDPTLLDWLDREIESKSVDAATICFQVSEEIANRHLKQVKQLVAELSSRGFAFAVEHFGVCRDPMRILNNLTMDYLKIDGSLMQSIASNQTRQEEVLKFARAARDKGIATIAERIEDANSMAVLFQLGIGFMQGHYVQEAEVVLEEPVARTPISLGAERLVDSPEAAQKPEAASAPEAAARSGSDSASKRKVATNAVAASNIAHDTTRGPQLTVDPGAGDGLELKLESDTPDAAVAGDG